MLIKKLLEKTPVYTLYEVVSAGRALANYNVTFKDTNGNLYNIWDLAHVKNAFLEGEVLLREYNISLEKAVSI